MGHRSEPRRPVVGFHSVSPEEGWEHGIPVGTGRVGALIHGAPRRHVLDLTHEDFFLPVTPRIPAPDLRDRLSRMRQALLHGDAETAGDLLAEAAAEHSPGGALVWTDPFVPTARLTLEGLSMGPVTDPVPGARRREVDLRTGEARISWTDARCGRQALTVEPRHDTSAIRVRISSERAGEMRLRLSPGADGQAAPVRASAEVQDDRAVLRVGAAETTLVPLRDTGLPGLRQEGGAVVAHLPLRPGEEVGVEIRVAVTDVPAHDPRLDGSELPPREELAQRSRLRLGAATHHAIHQEASTEELLEAARGGDPASEDALVELVYASARHTIISSTGTLPPNLTGLWTGTWDPAWSGDYTLNGNVTLGATASMISTGMPELRISLLRLISRHLPDFRENARRIFGAEGVLLPARLSTHGHASHFSVEFPHLFWIGGGPWMLRQGWDLFSATGDTELLDWLWSFAQEVMLCCETVVHHHHDDGPHLVPSYSPENTPRGAPNPLAVDATTDVAAIRDAVTVATRIGQLVGDDSRAPRWDRLRRSLPAPRITEEGTLAEWTHLGFPEEPHHRHTSHLYPFGTEGDELFETPQMRDAALATVRQRLAHRESDPPASREMAFGLCELGVVAARLGDAETALQVVRTLAARYWRPSMMSTHDPDAILNADASGGFPAVVAAMMLTSRPGEAMLLPALPEQWGTGSITGLCGHEGLIVEELTWDEHGARATLRRRPGSQAAWTTPELTISAGAGWEPASGETDLRLRLREEPTAVELKRAC